MRIRNPLLMNDWEISKTLQAVILVQAAMLAVSCCGYLGAYVPLVQVPISFVYLTFIPGILILRILRLHKLGNVQTLLYSMGTSLSFLMALGFLMSAISSTIGTNNPISLVPLAIVIASLVLLLCALSYARDKEFSNPEYLDLSFNNVSPQILLFCLLPFVTVFATFLMNYYGTNSLQMILLLILMAIPFIVVAGRISQRYYAFLLFVTSFSLLFHTSLISPYVWGNDVNIEIIVSRLALQSGSWNISFASNYSGMLSLIILAPIYSLFSNMSLPLVFKVLYPFIFSFVPLGLFSIYKRLTGDKIAFLSCFYFVTFEAFFVDMPVLGRQEIAELFLILVVLLVIEGRLKIRDRLLLLLIFGAALSVSHYGTSYVFLIILAVALPTMYLVLPRVRKAFRISTTPNKKDISIFFVFFTIFTLTWYAFVSPRSQPFVEAVGIVNSIVSNIGNMFTPEYNQPVAYLTHQLVPLQVIDRDIVLLSFFFILVGFIAVIFKRKGTKFTNEFIGFASGSLVLLFLASVLPLVAQALQSDRIITLSLIFLAPFCIIGLMWLVELLGGAMKHVSTGVGLLGPHKNNAYAALAVFLAIWVLFNSAFVYQVFDQPKVGRFALDNSVDFTGLNAQELSNAVWLNNYKQNNTVVWADSNKVNLLQGLVNFTTTTAAKEIKYQTTNKSFGNSYVFLGSYNLENKRMLVSGSMNNLEYVPTSSIPNASVISSNGGSVILLIN